MTSLDTPPGHLPPPQDTSYKSKGTPIRGHTEVGGEGLAANYTIDPSVKFTYWLCWELDYRQQLNPSLWKSILGPGGQHRSVSTGMTQLGTPEPPDGRWTLLQASHTARTQGPSLVTSNDPHRSTGPGLWP